MKFCFNFFSFFVLTDKKVYAKVNWFGYAQSHWDIIEHSTVAFSRLFWDSLLIFDFHRIVHGRKSVEWRTPISIGYQF